MADHFSAFSFVDRITACDPEAVVRGHFAVPAALPEFSPCLVAEAVGQLAAWAAMARDEFRRRPVAALAGEARMLGAAVPGHNLDLGVDFESRDHDAVVYAGWARVGERLVLTLHRCVGALLPLEDFDAPDAVRRHFELLCGPGVPGGRFRGIAAPDLVVVGGDPGKRLRATLQVPTSAPFFADHFPRRAVFPATLLLDAEIRLATDLARAVLGPRARPLRVTDVKMRSFILPGQTVEIDAKAGAVTNSSATIALTAQVDGKRAATARVELG